MTYLFNDNLKEKTEYLRLLYNEENERQGIIEGKLSQLLGQSGIILSLVGLFIPMYLDRLVKTDFYFQIGLIVIFLITLLFYFLTIFKSSRHLNAHKFDYKRKCADTVNQSFLTINDFHKEEIRDLLDIIKSNSVINDNKVTDLKKAYLRFRVANIFTAVLSIHLLGSMFFVTSRVPSEVNIKEPVVIKGLNEFSESFKKGNGLPSGDTIALERN